MPTPYPLSIAEVQFATELANPDFSLSVSNQVKDTIRKLLVALDTNNAALDLIATRVTDDDYDNPSSALEAIEEALRSTGRTVEHEI